MDAYPVSLPNAQGGVPQIPRRIMGISPWQTFRADRAGRIAGGFGRMEEKRWPTRRDERRKRCRSQKVVRYLGLQLPRQLVPFQDGVLKRPRREAVAD